MLMLIKSIPVLINREYAGHKNKVAKVTVVSTIEIRRRCLSRYLDKVNLSFK